MMESPFNDHESTGIAALIELFEKCLQEDAYHFFDEEAIERMLEYYEMQNNLERAEAVVDYAISRNPFSSDFLVRKAEFLLSRKRYSQALECLDKAVLFDAGEMEIYLIRSDIFVETNRIDEAMETLQQALEMCDDDEKDIVYAGLSDIHEIREDFESALDCLRKALDINPNNEDALYKIAHIVDMTDRYDDSIDMHTRITEREPYSWLAWYNLGRAYMGLGLYEKAIESFEFVMAIDENFDLVYRDAADIFYRMDQFEKAIEMFEAANAKSGGFEDYSFRIGMCYERMENMKAARHQYRKATRKDPYLHEAYFRIGETYRVEERYEAALVNYKKALKHDETNEDYICTIISIYKMLDRDADVIQYLTLLVNLRPDILSYWLDYLIFLFDAGRFEDVPEIATDAIGRCGHYAEFYYLLSAALFLSGKERDSMLNLEHALNLDHTRHVILYEVCREVAMHKKFQDMINLYRGN